MTKVRTFGVLIAMLPAPAAADTRIEYADEKSGVSQTVITIKDGKIRVDDANAATYTIYDQGSATLTTVDPVKKTYTALDEESLQEISGRMNDAMAEMRRQLEQMPPEQRAAMEKMMGGVAKSGKPMMDVKVDRTGKTLNKGGHDCRQVFFSVGSVARTELCVVDADRIEMTGSDRATFEAMQEQMKVFAETMSGNADANVTFDLDAMGGIPVYMKQDRERSGKVLTSVTHSGIDSGIFAIPAGYREEKIDTGE